MRQDLTTSRLRAVSVLIAAACLFTLSGCEDDERAKQQFNNPTVDNVGTFDGCDVKYVNRGYRDASFYLARCDKTATTTRNYDEKSGKQTFTRTRVVITQEIERLKREEQELALREQALSKLDAKERAALGLANDKSATSQ